MNRFGFAALVLVICCTVSVSCSAIKQVTAPEFLELASEIHNPTTIRSTSFIGATGGRAYLQCWRKALLFEPEYIVYWTSIAELPDEAVTRLKADGDLREVSDPQDNKPMPSAGR